MQPATISHTANPDYYNEVYLPLFDDMNRVKVLYGGRDSGKSDFIAQKLLIDCLNEDYFRCVMVRKQFNTIKDSQWETLRQVAEYMSLSQYFRFMVSPLEIRCLTNGNKFIARGMDKAEKAKSLKDPTHAWFEEADTLTEKDYDTLRFSLRTTKKTKIQEWLSFNSGDPTHWIPLRFFPTVELNGRRVLDVKAFEDENGYHNYIKSPAPNTTVLHTCFLDNEFIDEERAEMHFQDRAAAPNRYRVNSLGLFGTYIEGALWNWDMIRRVSEAPDMIRVGVALDPSAMGKDGSDECGIIAGGLGADGNIYITGDVSGVMSPNDWAKRAVNLYKDIRGDFIVAEKNQGGEMITSVFQNVKSPVMPKLVHASRGKRTRAEPVAALYEEGRVFHVGRLPHLENEMTTWDAMSGGLSPNRVDALVWLVTFLRKPGGNAAFSRTKPNRYK